MTKQKLVALFGSIERADIPAFLSFPDNEASFRFANLPVVSGLKRIEFLEGFCHSIHSISQDLYEIYECDGVFFVNGKVHYTRHDKTVLSVYFSNRNGKIKDYFIFVDNSSLYK